MASGASSAGASRHASLAAACRAWYVHIFQASEGRHVGRERQEWHKLMSPRGSNTGNTRAYDALPVAPLSDACPLSCDFHTDVRGDVEVHRRLLLRPVRRQGHVRHRQVVTPLTGIFTRRTTLQEGQGSGSKQETNQFAALRKQQCVGEKRRESRHPSDRAP